MNTVEYLTKGLNLSKIQLEAITELAGICGMKSLFEANVLDDEDEEMDADEDPANSFKPMNNLQREAQRIRNNDNNANSKKEAERLKRINEREEDLRKDRAKESSGADNEVDLHDLIDNKLYGVNNVGWGVDDGNDGLYNELIDVTSDDLQKLTDADDDDSVLSDEMNQLSEIIRQMCDTLNEVDKTKKTPYTCGNIIKTVCANLKTYTGNDDKLDSLVASSVSMNDVDVPNGKKIDDEDDSFDETMYITDTDDNTVKEDDKEDVVSSDDNENAITKLKEMVAALNTCGHFDEVNKIMNMVDDFEKQYPDDPYLSILKEINPIDAEVKSIQIKEDNEDSDVNDAKAQLNDRFARIAETIAPGMATGKVMSSADLRRSQLRGATQRALSKTRTTPDGKRVLSTTFKGKV